jgi:histidinol dehydrogenase
MRRVTGLQAALEAVADVRRRGDSGILTDGNGLYDRKLTPDEFARRVIADVRRDGDAALRRIAAALDGVEPGPFEVPQARLQAALKAIAPETRAALEKAAERVQRFQQSAMPKSWRDASGQFGEEVRPLGRAGVYVPGGTAPLASSVIMTVVPAKVAGVDEVVLVTPSRGDSDPHPAVLAAAVIAGAGRVFRIGGAQAIAALAYGTESVPPVDVICGPGNAFVTAAKKAVFGDVGIDGLYGPTETAVIADESADPAYAAADLLAQAEHDVVALPVLIATSAEVADRIESQVTEQIKSLSRKKIASQAAGNGITAIVASVEEAIQVANALAPEHLCVSVVDAASYLPSIRYAGGIFLGELSAEVMADYVAGPSHVMPTGGTARFASALSVRNFLRISPFLNFDEKAFLDLSQDAATLAREEGLDGHAAAAELRRKKMVGE